MGFVHMFADGVQEKLALVRASVNIDLPSVVRPRQQEFQNVAPRENTESKREDVCGGQPHSTVGIL